MNTFLVAAAVLVLVGLAGVGVATITTGWVPPIGRSRVLRPQLWGYGALMAAVGMSMFLFLGPFHGPPADPNPFAWVGFAVGLAGNMLQLAAQRPGRV
jgi:hypothetical protein